MKSRERSVGPIGIWWSSVGSGGAGRDVDCGVVRWFWWCVLFHSWFSFAACRDNECGSMRDATDPL